MNTPMFEHKYLPQVLKIYLSCLANNKCQAGICRTRCFDF
jgi:hypothetical protein